MKQDNSGKWGLLGLLGLAGLAGLLKRPHTEVRTVETQRVEPTAIARASGFPFPTAGL